MILLTLTSVISSQMHDAYAPPSSITSSTVSSATTVTIVFSLPVDFAIGDFTDLNVAGEARSVDSIAEASPGATVTITFSGGSAVGTDATGDIDIAAIANLGSGNTFAGEVNRILTDAQAPVFSSAETVSSTSITVTYSESVDTTGVVNGDYTIGGVASTPSVTGIAGSGTSTLTLTLDASIVSTDTPTVTYTQTGMP